jgi:hypothetical protein
MKYIFYVRCNFCPLALPTSRQFKRNRANGDFTVWSFISLFYCSLTRTACSESIVDRFEVATTNKLFSVSAPGHGIVWETCCLEHGCQCPWHLEVHSVWLYICCISRTKRWIPIHVLHLQNNTVHSNTRVASPEHTVGSDARVASPEQHSGLQYTFCISRTTQCIAINMLHFTNNTVDCNTHVASLEQNSGFRYTCCISRTTQWITIYMLHFQNTVDSDTRVASSEQHSGFRYTCCISRTTQWIPVQRLHLQNNTVDSSTQVAFPE